MRRLAGCGLRVVGETGGVGALGEVQWMATERVLIFSSAQLVGCNLGMSLVSLKKLLLFHYIGGSFGECLLAQ